MKKRLIKILCTVLALTMLSAAFFGCGGGDKSDGEKENLTESDLMLGLRAQMIAERKPDGDYYKLLESFAAAMVLKSLSAQENSALSPIASMYSVSLVANVLSEKNRTELLHTFGDLKIDALNEYNATYAHIMKKETGATAFSSFRLNSAKTKYAPDAAFLQLCIDYYGANGYRLNFDGGNLNAHLGEWVMSKLGIQGVTVDAEADAETQSVLADTLAFTDSFELGFSGKETGIFNLQEGTKEVSYLVSSEELYVSTARSKGFAKRLENGYTFVALLPQGSNTLEQLTQSLDAQTLKACFNGITERETFAIKIPEFSFISTSDAVPAIKALGAKSLFESKITSESEKEEFPLGKLINFTSVTLTENGFTTSSSVPAAPILKTEAPTETMTYGTFDKPFAFIIYDTSGVPVTVGTVVNPGV